uniref:Energy-coupling factor transporter transmembrane protein EcfT n=1 Tax=Thermofilum pendens TaxID=2269 RepID=A0A7C4F9U4_THEPE
MEALRAFRFKRENTVIDKADPRVRALLSASLAALSLYAQSVEKHLMVILTVLAVAAVARRLRKLAGVVKAALPLSAVIFALNWLVGSRTDLVQPLVLALRFLALSASLSLFFMTTSPDELSLMLESMRLPREYSMLVTMSFRFVPTLALDVEAVMHALQSRGLELERGSITRRVKNYLYLMVPLIVYEVRRSLMAAEALEARGFGSPRKPTRYRELRAKGSDYLFVVLLAVYVALFLAL